MRRVLVVLLSLVTVVAAGCGGGDGDGNGGGGTSKQQYGRELSRTTSALQEAFAELGKGAGQPTSVKAGGLRLERGAAALDRAATSFAGIEPPTEATAAHRKLVAGLKDLAAVFRRGADAAERNDAKGLQQALQGLAGSKGVREIDAAQRELQRQGIQVTTTAS